MLATFLVAFSALERKVKHFDLGKVDGLTLSVDLDIDVTYNAAPYITQDYHARFVALDSKGAKIDEKLVNLGTATNKLENFLIEDRFCKGYKQLFISLHYRVTWSYLFGFRNRKFYTAFYGMNGRVLPSRSGTWKLEDSYPRRGMRVLAAPNVEMTKTSVSWTWLLTPQSKPLIR